MPHPLGTLSTSYTLNYSISASQMLHDLDWERVEDLARELTALRRRGGRLFLIGLGGSAANCSHAANDFRKLCGIEAYCGTDNVAELTAAANDMGWISIFTNWLIGCRVTEKDALFVMSVGGGDLEKQISPNICTAVDMAKAVGCRVLGIVGREAGYVYQHGDCVLLAPSIERQMLTPLVESLQAIVWHCLVSHPNLQLNPTTW